LTYESASKYEVYYYIVNCFYLFFGKGLKRCGKSCRLRWINYLRSDLKRGNITPEEEELVVKLHSTLGNRYSIILLYFPNSILFIMFFIFSHLYSFNLFLCTVSYNNDIMSTK